MRSKTQTYSIRIELCEKCYEHYNHPSRIQSKSYHLARKPSNNLLPKTPNFVEQQEEYRKHFQTLVHGLDQLQDYYLEQQSSQSEQLNYRLSHSPKRLQQSRRQKKDLPHLPIFKVLKNVPYKYLSKFPDTKVSTKRYLNNTTKKITEFPRKDSFEVYFQNLLVFSKLTYGKWPNIRLIEKIIKSLVDYCRNQSPLMENLKPFINDYLDIKSLNPNSCLNPPLYEYLILTSNLESTQIDSQQDEDKLIDYLQMIINGKVKVLTVMDPKNQLTTEQTFRKKEILPYSLIDHKVKASTIQGIYLAKENRIERSSKHINQQSSVKFNFTQNKVQQSTSHSKQLKSKPKSRPLSSNLGYLRKSPSLFNGLSTNRNELFSLIKMGDIQENLFQQQTQFNKFQQQNKNLNMQLQKLCSIDNKQQNTTKTQGKITQRAKLFVNTNLHSIKTQNKDQQPYENSIIWTKFDKQLINSKRNSKNSQINEAQELEVENNHNKENQKVASSHRNSANNLLKIVPSKKIKRASLFLNQRQSNLLAEQLKNLTKNQQNNENNENQQPIQNENLKKNRNQRNSRSRAYKQDESSSSSGDNHSIYSRASDDGMNNQQKIKVLQHNIAKSKSSRGSRQRKSSKVSKQEFNKDKQLNDDIENLIKPKSSNPHHNSVLLKSPNKLSVRSRSKSSFYYSNAKNNSLLELINASQTETRKEDEEKKEDRKKSSKKTSRLSLAQGKRQFHNGEIPVSKVEEGVQCNIEQDLLNLDLDKVKSLEGVKSQQSYQQLKTGRDTFRDTVRDTLVESVKDIQRDSKAASKSSFLQEFGALFQNREQRQALLTNTMRSSRVSGFNNRISKYSFRNHQSFREQLNQSRDKEQDELVAVFPENRFNHAFIVHNFVQKNFYDVEIKKMFTTSESGKCQVFEFDVNCGEVYRQWRVHSVSRLLGHEERKLMLFPKIFQQVERYSTPLVQVVNRLLKFHPITISRLFTNAHGLSPLGQYCIWVYHKGINQFKPVFVNDSVPFYLPDLTQQTNEYPPRPVTPVYAPLSNDNSIWFMLLEKALAKVVGSYYALNETSIADIFSMLTGCPVVSIDHITVKKLEKIFDEKIFLNKKAYVYGLRKLSSNNMRIDRVVGMERNESESSSSVAVIEEKQGTQMKMNLESIIRTYQEICLVFFNMSFVFNQVAFPMLEKSDEKVSSLITFYIINQQVQQKNEIYLCLGGFAKPQLKSKITIYHQAQQQQNNYLKQLQLTDPLSYYNQKYTYQGEIQKNGNYFFQTQIKYGKYLCMIEADYQPDHQYYISTYTSKPITIHNIQHNYTEVNRQQTDPLEKIIAATKYRMKLKKNKHLQPITEDQPIVIDYPLKVFRNSIDDNVLPYDFSNYKQNKKRILKSSVSLDSLNPMSIKWVIEKQFVQDEDNLLPRRQRNISGLISHIQRQQEKQQNAKLKRQLQTNQKDAVLKMMSRVGKNQDLWQNEGILRRKKVEKKKGKKINWAQGGDMAMAMQTR